MNGDMSGDKSVSFVIYGEPASKANSRIHRIINGVPRSIKSKKAQQYGSYFEAQAPQLGVPFVDDVSVEMTIYYASRRPDLDESLILDLMQGRIYKNDRQVKRKLITWALDRDKPRAEITVRVL